MRPRDIIQKDGTRKDDLIIEILLDIRDLLGGKVIESISPTITEAPLPIVESPKRKKKRKYTKRKLNKQPPHLKVE